MTSAATCCTPITAPILDDAEAAAIADVFRALADPARVKLLHHIESAGPDGICVCHLTSFLGLTQPAVSYHLKQMRQAGLLTRTRRGRFMWYAVTPGALARVSALAGAPLPRAS